MEGRRSRPEEEPPRSRGKVGAWLFGTTAGLIAVAFVAIALVAVIVAVLA